MQERESQMSSSTDTFNQEQERILQMSSRTIALNLEKEIFKLQEQKLKAIEERIRMITPSKPDRSQPEKLESMSNPAGEVRLVH